MGGTSSKKSEEDLRLCQNQMTEVQRNLTRQIAELQECKIEAEHLERTHPDTFLKQEHEANNIVAVVDRKRTVCQKEMDAMIDSIIPLQTFATMLSAGVVFRDLMKHRPLSIHNQHTGEWCINGGEPGLWELGFCANGPGTPFQLCVDPRVKGVETGSVAIACQFQHPVDWEKGLFLVLTTAGTVRVVNGYPANDSGAAWRLGAISGPARPMIIFFARHDNEEKAGWMLSNSVGNQNVDILKTESLYYVTRLHDQLTIQRPILAWNVDLR